MFTDKILPKGYSYIENWQNKNLHCFYCGGTESVKYSETVTIFSDSSPRTVSVCVCNKCVLDFNKKDNEED